MLEDKIEWLKLHSTELVKENSKLKRKLLLMTNRLKDFSKDLLEDSFEDTKHL